MQMTRAPGSTGGTNSRPATGTVSPDGFRERKPAASDQNSSSPETTVTCAPSSDSAATSTGPLPRRMPTILMSGPLHQLPGQERDAALGCLLRGPREAEPHVVGVLVEIELGRNPGLDEGGVQTH